ncbi:YecA family protein [Pantoea ananatis]|uniref:YecA family protein n=1 Tax=Pantoea ananas TaxID=553 RepID=UPI00024175D5|nr:SEC-C domain-containing protein [Pantoea ananatis]CCF10205.1 putative cytoplasmic protein [Pantoea ananatis LMG 5342]
MKKLGRNTLCWCNSGKKYKKCHLGRDKEAPFSRAEAHGLLKKFTNVNKCSVPDKLQKECKNRIVKAHTLSKGNSLKEIAHEGHVLGIKHGLKGVEKDNGNIRLERIGINQASTFTGFCSYHDKELFSVIEDKPFIESQQQCTMLAYRPLMREVYVKEANYEIMEESRNFDRGLDFKDQLLWAQISAENIKGSKLALQDLNYIKNKVERSIERRVFDELKHLIIRLENVPKIMACGIHAPIVDIFGVDVQEINLQENIRPAYMTTNLIALDGKGYLILSWLPEDDVVIRKFVSGIYSCPIEILGDKLTIYIFTFFENIFASELWWNGLGDLQESVNKMIMQGVVMHAYNITDIENDKNLYKALEVSGFIEI